MLLSTYYVLICFSLVIISDGNKYDLKPEFNQCRSVFGFCQKPFAAMFSGGFFVNSTIDNGYFMEEIVSNESCHQGIFDVNTSDHHLISAVSNRTLQVLNKSWCKSYIDIHKVNCFGIPQCGRGSSCNYDYSCVVDSPNKIVAYFQSYRHRNLTFGGVFKFKNGAFRRVSCSVQGLTTNSTFPHVHGINVEIMPDRSGRNAEDNDFLSIDNACLASDLKNNPSSPKATLYKKYRCVATAITKKIPLEEGDVFQHLYSYNSYNKGSSTTPPYFIVAAISVIFTLLNGL